MLVLTRKIGEAIKIDNDIQIVLLDIKGKYARIGIKAPKEIPVFRSEMHSRLKEEAESLLEQKVYRC